MSFHRKCYQICSLNETRGSRVQKYWNVSHIAQDAPSVTNVLKISGQLLNRFFTFMFIEEHQAPLGLTVTMIPYKPAVEGRSQMFKGVSYAIECVKISVDGHTE